MFKFRKIWLRLTFTYGLVFILAITVIDASLIMLYRNHQYKKTQELYTEVAGIVSEMAGRNLKFTNFMNMSYEEEANSLSGRVLILDSKGIVIADSSKQFEGREMKNSEIRKVYSSKKSSIGYYHMNDEHFAMLAYPIFKSEVFSGAVLISYEVGEIRSEVFSFSLSVVIISICISIIVFIISFYLGFKISRPISQLTHASTEILNGNMGTTVDINTVDEIGTLAKTFNMMSEEIYRTDLGRKRFVSSVSHDLKTPLASIKALIEPFIGEENINPVMLNEHLTDIDYEIDRLSNLVKSLVTTARLEEMKPLPEQFILREEIMRVVRILTPLLYEKKINISVNCSNDLEENIDKAMFREVLTNLMDNAIKYGNEEGNIVIDVKNKNGKTNVYIRDDGIGIDQKDIPYIFDNFFRADTVRSSGKGSGIGLYTVKRIVEINGWNIEVKSSIGEGSEFKLSL